MKNIRVFFYLKIFSFCGLIRNFAGRTGPSRKHAYINLIPLNPTFIYEIWGLPGCTLFVLFKLKNIDCEYSLEPPRRGGSNEYQQSMF